MFAPLAKSLLLLKYLPLPPTSSQTSESTRSSFRQIQTSPRTALHTTSTHYHSRPNTRINRNIGRIMIRRFIPRSSRITTLTISIVRPMRRSHRSTIGRGSCQFRQSSLALSFLGSFRSKVISNAKDGYESY